MVSKQSTWKARRQEIHEPAVSYADFHINAYMCFSGEGRVCGLYLFSLSPGTHWRDVLWKALLSGWEGEGRTKVAPSVNILTVSWLQTDRVSIMVLALSVPPSFVLHTINKMTDSILSTSGWLSAVGEPFHNHCPFSCYRIACSPS